jgi:hypothetical protein
MRGWFDRGSGRAEVASQRAKSSSPTVPFPSLIDSAQACADLWHMFDVGEVVRAERAREQLPRKAALLLVGPR